MASTTAFLVMPTSPAPFSFHSRSFTSGISLRLPTKPRVSVHRMCTAKPPPETSPHSDPAEEAIPDSPPSKNPFAALFRSLRARKQTLASYGVAALISYGLFDAVTYSVSFLLSLRAYIAAGKTLTWRTLPQVLAVMWGINNLSRPFRVAGALALAPVVDRRIVQPIRSFLSKRSGEN